MSRTRAIFLIALLGFSAAGWMLLHPARPAFPAVRSPAAPPRGPGPITTASGALLPASPQEVIAATPAGILHFADSLNAPDRTARDDVQLLVSLLGLYRRTTQGMNPVGENREITAALTGKNRVSFAFISPENPAINAAGELCDRWGTPFVFHQISGTVMEVRSAGPDRRPWTADDLAANP
jgi:hypothetical protein